MTTELVANAFQTTLASSCTSGTTTITVNNAPPAVLQAGGQFRVLIDGELIIVPATSSTTWSGVTRGAESTSAAAHNAGAVVAHILTAAAISALSAGGLTNPMTTSQDLIVGGAGGTPGRLAAGASGTVLTMEAGTVAWEPPTGGMSNPMTTSQDLIVGGAAGAPGRLAIGGSNEYLGSSGGVVGYATVTVGQVAGAAPLASPTFTGTPAAPTPPADDNSTKIATTQFVETAVGSPGIQVLAESGDTSGLADDTAFYTALAQIYNNLPAGKIIVQSGSYYTVAGWAWPANTPAGSITGHTTSSSTSVSSLAAGTISVPANGTYQVFGLGIPAGSTLTISGTSGTLNNAAVLGAGVGTTMWIGSTVAGGGHAVGLEGTGDPVLFGVGNNMLGCIWCHRTIGPTQPPGHPPGPRITGITTDGTNATGQCYGIDTGDYEFGYIDVTVQNWIDGTNADSRGACLINRFNFTEKSYFRIFSLNNDILVYITWTGSTGGDNSCEYNTYDLELITYQANQLPIVQKNASLNGSRMHVGGDIAQVASQAGGPASSAITNLPAAVLTLTSPTSAKMSAMPYFGMKVEGNAAGTGVIAPYTIVSDGNCEFRGVSGQIITGMSGIKMNSTEFTFHGALGSNDYTGTLADVYPSTVFPGYSGGNSTWTNQGPDAMTWLSLPGSGGSITALAINGISAPVSSFAASALLGPYIVPGAGAVKITGAGTKPTLTIIPAHLHTEGVG